MMEAAGGRPWSCAWCGEPQDSAGTTRWSDRICWACDALLAGGDLRMDCFATGRLRRWRITHLPSGTVVTGEEGDSYLGTRRAAMATLVRKMRPIDPSAAG